MRDLPEPPVPADCDCTDLDGFMLNVERLMASELVALSNHEVVAGALFLWCRAWKQRPAASLPDDDRVLAAFARLSLPRFRKLKSEVARGFIKCSDGRLYHPVLAAEALTAWEKKKAFQAKREADAERLRKWRQSQRGNADEPSDETRFVAEGQGQGQVRDRDNMKERGGEPAGSGAPRPSDFGAVLFGACRKWLQEATGKDDQTCRRLLGKWRKALPDGDLVQLLKNAQEQGHIEDPVPWIERAIQLRKGPPKRQHGADFN